MGEEARKWFLKWVLNMTTPLSKEDIDNYFERKEVCMKNLKEKIEAYKNHLSLAESVASEIGDAIVSAVRDIIPNLKYSVGFSTEEEERGIDVICFFGGQGYFGDGDDFACLVEEVFPELEGFVDTPFGCNIPEDKVDEVLERLRELARTS